MTRRCSSSPARSSTSSASSRARTSASSVSSAPRPEDSASLRPMSRLPVGVEPGDLGVQGDGLVPYRVEVAYDLGELVVAAGEPDRLHRALGRRQPRRAAAQYRQRPGQRAGDGRRDAHDEQEQHAEEGDQQLQPLDVVVAQRGEEVERSRASVDSTERIRSMRAVRAEPTEPASALRSAVDSVGRSVRRLR